MLEAQPCPIHESRRLGKSAHNVYMFLWDSAHMTGCERLYNTSTWTVKGVAGELMMSRNTVAKAIDKLLDDGLIQLAGQERNPNGSNNSIWGITHPQMIEACRHAIEHMGPPSQRLKTQRSKAKKVQIPQELSEDLWSEGGAQN